MKQNIQTDVSDLNLAIYKEVFSHTPDLSYVVDKNGELLDCNQQFLNKLGTSSLNNILSLYAFLKKAVHWSDNKIQNMKTKNMDTIASGKALLDEPEHSARTVNQKNIIEHYLISRIPLMDQNNTVMALLVIIKNVDAEKLMAEQLDKIQKELLQFNATKNPPILSENHFDSPI